MSRMALVLLLLVQYNLHGISLSLYFVTLQNVLLF